MSSSSLTAGLQAFLEHHAGDGWRSVDDFRGLRRDRIVDALEDPAARTRRSISAGTTRPKAMPTRKRATSRLNHDHDDGGNVGRGNRRSVPEAHVLRVVGAGRRRSHPDGAGEGRLFLDARREAIHRLQQPADVRQHRPRRRARRSARSRRRRTTLRVRQSVHGDRAASEARAPSSRSSLPATSTCSSSPTAAPKRTRTR